jgi:hypothetical protein
MLTRLASPGYIAPMERRSVRKIVGVIALAVMLLIILPSAGLASGKTLQFTVSSAHSIATKHGYRFTADLDNTQGHKVGSYSGRCTRSTTSVIHCHVKIKLANGTLTARSVSLPPNHVAHGRIVGGTGAYKGATGHFRETGGAGGDRVKLTIG